MKVLLLSDLHSNYPALERIWSQHKDADLVICAGDLVDYGPFPVETIEWAQDHCAVVVKGNHDEDVVREFRQSGEPGTWRFHNAQKLSQQHVAYLDSLPYQAVVEIAGRKYGVTHKYQNYDIIRSLAQFESFSTERFGENLRWIIFGHTHRLEVHYLADDLAWLNPGSISYRRTDDLDQTAHYMVIENQNIYQHRLEYDKSALYNYVLQSDIRGGDRKVALHFWGPRP